MPESGVCVQQRINLLKPKRFATEELKRDFIEKIKEERAPTALSSKSLESPSKGKEEEGLAEDLDDDEYRMISRTLFKVIRADVDYNFVLKPWKNSKKICSKAFRDFQRQVEP